MNKKIGAETVGGKLSITVGDSDVTKRAKELRTKTAPTPRETMEMLGIILARLEERQ